MTSATTKAVEVELIGGPHDGLRLQRDLPPRRELTWGMKHLAADSLEQSGGLLLQAHYRIRKSMLAARTRPVLQYDFTAYVPANLASTEKPVPAVRASLGRTVMAAIKTWMLCPISYPLDMRRLEDASGR